MKGDAAENTKKLKILRSWISTQGHQVKTTIQTVLHFAKCSFSFGPLENSGFSETNLSHWIIQLIQKPIECVIAPCTPVIQSHYPPGRQFVHFQNS